MKDGFALCRASEKGEGMIGGSEAPGVLAHSQATMKIRSWPSEGEAAALEESAASPKPQKHLEPPSPECIARWERHSWPPC